MSEFAFPWAFLLAPLPLLVWKLVPPWRKGEVAVRLPFFRQLAETADGGIAGGVAAIRPRLALCLLATVWLLCLAALARPSLVGDPVEKNAVSRDILMAVDISGSMATRDFISGDGRNISRLDGVRDVVDGFAARSLGERIGLIVFGSRPYVQTPFTQDSAAIRFLLGRMDVDMAGPRTMIGDAVALGLNMFEVSDAPSRILVLLTDGADTGSRVPPVKAAEVARLRNVRIFAIGIGDPDGTDQMRADYDTLSAMARATNGAFFRADSRAGLEAAYAQIEAMAPHRVETVSFYPRIPVFRWPLAAAFVLLLLFHALEARETRRGLPGDAP
tara:strand:+ start:19734 stop:20723 length:990 start_codon:yes stop_codon:yes gene_type:complete